MSLLLLVSVDDGLVGTYVIAVAASVAAVVAAIVAAVVCRRCYYCCLLLLLFAVFGVDAEGYEH